MKTKNQKKMPTKKEVLSRQLDGLFDWLVEEKIVTMAELEEYTSKSRVDVNKAVGYLENFFLPAYKAKKLEEYVEREALGSNLMFFKNRKKLGKAHIKGLAKRIGAMCRVIVMKPAKK